MAARYDLRICFSAGRQEAIALAEAAKKEKCSQSEIVRQLIYRHLTKTQKATA
jgi:hypothetical protein